MATQSTKSKAKSTPKKNVRTAAKSTKKTPPKAVKSTTKTKSTAVATKKAPVKSQKKVKTVDVERKSLKTKLAFMNRSTTTKTAKVSRYSWNAWLAFLYAAQGGALLVVAKATVAVPITVSYLANDALLSKAQNDTVFSPAVQSLFDLNITYAVAGLLFTLAVLHAFAAIRRTSYEASIAKAASPFRWLVSFVALTGTLLLTGLAVGVRDVVSLLAIAFFVVVSSIVALVAEELARDRSGIIHKTFLYRIHFAAYFAPVLAVATYFAASSVYDGTLPIFINYLFASVVLLSFALTSILRLQLAAEKKWADYIYSEKMYFIITFILVSVTSWQLFAGLLK